MLLGSVLGDLEGLLLGEEEGFTLGSVLAW